MKKYWIIVVLASIFTISPVTEASSASQALGTCMIDSLTGKERKKLAQWIFFAMSAHPEITQYANVTTATRSETDKFIGTLVTRLMTSDCPEQARQAIKESSLAVQKSFELVGRVAMQELMTNPQVTMAISGFEQHMDREKFIELEKN